MEKSILLVDDDVVVCKTLELLVKNNSLGRVVCTLQSGENAVEEILFYNPDIVLVDLLLPVLDGIGIVRAARARGFAGKFIMLSHVSEHELVSRAYESGVLFFLNKPLNFIEGVNIIKNVSNQIDLERSLEQIRSAVQLVGQGSAPAPQSLEGIDGRITTIFTDIGIVGESGSHELRGLVCKAYEYQRRHPRESCSFSALYSELLACDNPAAKKALEQRVRRTIQKALTNLAELGSNDYANSVFMDYSTLLFDFKQVRQEMRHLLHPAAVPSGKISTKKFIAGVLARLP